MPRMTGGAGDYKPGGAVGYNFLLERLSLLKISPCIYIVVF
jgi:hypothetical protein